MARRSSDWRVSLHGGHSGEFCDHAEGMLEDLVRAAIDQGFTAYGITEHGPRAEDQFLYKEERDLGWDAAHVDALFARYASRVDELRESYAGSIALLKGFEAEVVPSESYVDRTRALRAQYGFDYIVGSVHWVDEIIIDYTRAEFERAVAHCGGLEELAVRYYETVADMVDRLCPEIVGHLDLVRKYAPDEESVSTFRTRAAALAALDVIARRGSFLDVNTAGYRKGLGRPYPAPWLVEAAARRGVQFTLGDDSHRPSEVGFGFSEARQYLLDLDVREIMALCPSGSGIRRRAVSLVEPE